MKKVLMKAAVFLFILGINTPAKAETEMNYGPLVIDDASVLPKKTFEVVGFYNAALPGIELVSPPGPGGKTKTTAVYLPVSGLTGAVSYGLTDSWELGISANKISKDYFIGMDTSSEPVTGTKSGMGDLLVKAKFGAPSGKVAGGIVLFLPTAKDGLLMPAGAKNDIDTAFKFVWTPVKDRTGGLHLNLGYTMWGKDDTPKKQSTTMDYGIGLEFFLGRSKSVTWTAELAGNTLKDPFGNTPLDIYTGMRITASKNVQISGLLAFGASKGSAIYNSELGFGIGFGIGLKWLGEIF